MPLYVYDCLDHGRFEVLAKMSDPPPTCPRCGSLVTRCVTAATIDLRGTGWYRDGYGLRAPKG